MDWHPYKENGNLDIVGYREDEVKTPGRDGQLQGERPQKKPTLPRLDLGLAGSRTIGK